MGRLVWSFTHNNFIYIKITGCKNNNLQIKGIEEKHNIFSFVVTKGDILELPIYNSFSCELGSRLLQLWHWHSEN